MHHTPCFDNIRIDKSIHQKENGDIMFHERAIPLAYFFTFTCYGTWLHGEKPSSVDRFNNTPGTDFISLNNKRANWVKRECMKSLTY